MEDERSNFLTKIDFKRLVSYLRIWVLMSKNSFLIYFYQKTILFIFLFGKVLRFSFFSLFLLFIVRGVGNLAGYSANQALFFFLTFNIVDILGQFLFREVYRFRPLIVSGDLDLILVKPFSPLFRVLMGGADFIDLLTIPPLIIITFWVGSALHPSYGQTILYFFLILNALLISTAFHIAVLSFGIITFEIDHMIMIFRDLLNLGRFPIDIYKEPLKGILTYLIPVGIMVSIPAKALLGVVTPLGVIASFLVGMVLIFLSLRFWRYALRFYSSASS